MEDKSCSPVPSLSEWNISYGMHGRTRQVAETISATMAPNVGLPYSTTEEGRSDWPSRRDTGYVSHVNLSTPDDFRSKASGRLRPDSNADPESCFAGNDRIHRLKNVISWDPSRKTTNLPIAFELKPSRYLASIPRYLAPKLRQWLYVMTSSVTS